MDDGRLRFHVREVAADLALAAVAVEQSVRAIADQPGIAAVRLGEAISVLTHDLDHHIPEIGRIVGVDVPGESPAIAEAVDIATISEDLTGGAAQLRTVLENNGSLGQVTVLIGQLWSALLFARPRLITVQKALVRRADDADPDAARRRHEDELLAVPERVLSHEHPRDLTTCPRCGAALTSDDRTRDGSYCEACRTRWVPTVT